MYTELRQPLPLEVLDLGGPWPAGSGSAIAVIDYGPEQHLLWVVIMDHTKEIWSVPNPSVRASRNYSMGRL